MTAELCHLGLIEIGCLVDASWLQTSAWASTAFPRRRTSPTDSGPAEHDTFDAAVHHAADRLPLEQAHAVWLVDVCGLTYAQAADETGITPKRFAKRLHAARSTIRKAVS
jgi:DNA-directed RNA polymerase specialized sigma24 family protein